MVGWVASSMAVAVGITDCNSVVVCAARWSHMASGDGMVYSSGLYHDSLPAVVGWVAPLVVLVDSTTASEHPYQTFHASLFLCVFSFLLCCVLNMP